MMHTALFYTQYALTLLFGIVLAFTFSGLRWDKRNILSSLLLFVFSGSVQVWIYSALGEELTWQLYPLFVHLPLLLWLCLVCKKNILTGISSIALAYLCCQPSKWIGLLLDTTSMSDTGILGVRIAVVLVTAFIILRFSATYIAELFNKDTRSVLIFSIVPLVYYVFDYVVGVYTDLWVTHHLVVSEFLAFFLCVSFVTFCVAYYQEYEKKAAAERKEQILNITAQQQAKEIIAIKQSNIEAALLRHDMRHLLNSLTVSIESGDKENSLKMISGFASQVESVSLHRYCANDTLNYILANFEGKCRAQEIAFHVTIETEEMTVDEIALSSIISNALDNAINAQTALPVKDRYVKFMLKTYEGKLLLSVRNPFKQKPHFDNGIPVASAEGHGYGTQSIRYMTEKLGGKYQFSIQDSVFVLRVVI